LESKQIPFTRKLMKSERGVNLQLSAFLRTLPLAGQLEVRSCGKVRTRAPKSPPRRELHFEVLRIRM
jgi:hypothetical protein